MDNPISQPPFVLAIAEYSGSGKSTLVRNLANLMKYNSADQ